jgi:hypothetical protein
MEKTQPLDRIIAVGVALLIAAFALSALGPISTAAAEADEAIGKRYDDSDEVTTVDDDDDGDPDQLKGGSNTGTTKGTGKSNSKSNTGKSGNGGGGTGNSGGGGGTGNSGT